MKKIVLVLVLFLLLLVPMQALAGSVTLTWNAPTTRTDGSPLSLSEISKYRVYYGQTSGVYTLQQDVANPGTLIVSTQIVSLATGTWYFAVSDFDTSIPALESAKTPEVSKFIPFAPPSPVTALSGVVSKVGVN